jgi:hypothetical protein
MLIAYIDYMISTNIYGLVEVSTDVVENNVHNRISS